MKVQGGFLKAMMMAAIALSAVSGSAFGESQAPSRALYCATKSVAVRVARDARSEMTAEQFGVALDIAVDDYRDALLSESGFEHLRTTRKGSAKFRAEQDPRIAKMRRWVSLFNSRDLTRDEVSYLFASEFELLEPFVTDVSCGESEAEGQHGTERPGFRE